MVWDLEGQVQYMNGEGPSGCWAGLWPKPRKTAETVYFAGAPEDDGGPAEKLSAKRRLVWRNAPLQRAPQIGRGAGRWTLKRADKDLPARVVTVNFSVS